MVHISYRSTSGDALSLLAGVLPLGLEAKLRVDNYCARKKSDVSSSGQLFSKALTEWKNRVEKCKLNPALRSLLLYGRTPSRIRCGLNYWFIQLLTGHGSFRSNLKNIKARVTDNCSRCAVRQNNQHILFDCCAVSQLKGSRVYALTQNDSFDWSGDLQIGSLLSSFIVQAVKT